jgi:hypothetical protein
VTHYCLFLLNFKEDDMLSKSRNIKLMALIIYGLSFNVYAEYFIAGELSADVLPGGYAHSANSAALTGIGAGSWSASSSEGGGKFSGGILAGAYANQNMGAEIGYRFQSGIDGDTSLGSSGGFNARDHYSVSGGSFHAAGIFGSGAAGGWFGKLGLHRTQRTLQTEGIGNILSIGSQKTSAKSVGLLVGVGGSSVSGSTELRAGLDILLGVKHPNLSWPTSQGTFTKALYIPYVSGAFRF